MSEDTEDIVNIFTKGALVCILNNGIVQNPVLQVLAIRVMSMPGRTDRYLLYLSDSECLCAYAVLQTNLNHMVESQLPIFSIIQLNHYAVSSITDPETNVTKKVLVIFDLVVLAQGDRVGYQVGMQNGEINEVQDFQLRAAACPITSIEDYEIEELLRDIELLK